MKKKVLKGILIVVALLVLVVLVHTIRNMIIISNLQNKISDYAKMTNYHASVNSSYKDGTSLITDFFRKDEKKKVAMTRKQNDSVNLMTMYDNGERIDIFWDTEEPKDKTAKLNADSLIEVQISNFLETENFLEFLVESFCTRISSKDVDGVKCYKIVGIANGQTLIASIGQEVYIEKDTGLVKKIVNEDQVINRTYEFDNVQDDVFVEPNVGEYRLQ